MIPEMKTIIQIKTLVENFINKMDLKEKRTSRLEDKVKELYPSVEVNDKFIKICEQNMGEVWDTMRIYYHQILETEGEEYHHAKRHGVYFQ